MKNKKLINAAKNWDTFVKFFTSTWQVGATHYSFYPYGYHYQPY